MVNCRFTCFFQARTNTGCYCFCNRKSKVFKRRNPSYDTASKGADGELYAIAQGNLAVGGLGVEGADGSSVSVNIPTVGRIPKGATVEKNG